MKAKPFIPAVVIAIVLSGTAISQAQILCTIPCPIWDPLAIAKQVIMSELQDVINTVTQHQAEKLYKMSWRLSEWTSLAKYLIDRDDMPEWRIHNYFTEDVLYAKPFNYALTYGDATGEGYEQVVLPRRAPGGLFDGLSATAGAFLRSEQALVELADSAIIRGTHETGRLRFNGREESEAIIAMQEDVTKVDNTEALTAVLDKMSGEALVEARNKQARGQLQAAILEQLLVEQAWDRNAEAELWDMVRTQLGAATDDEGLTALVTESGDTLRHFWQFPAGR